MKKEAVYKPFQGILTALKTTNNASSGLGEPIF
jgi:hypothetical protein